MRTSTRAAVLITASAAGAVATRQALAARRRARDERPGRVHTITVELPYDEVSAPGALPAPLSDLGDAVQIELRAAPGDRGTEIAVRATGAEVSDGDIRRALRESRSLLEVGYVLLPDRPATTEPTLRNRPLRAATAHGREGGLL